MRVLVVLVILVLSVTGAGVLVWANAGQLLPFLTAGAPKGTWVADSARCASADMLMYVSAALVALIATIQLGLQTRTHAAQNQPQLIATIGAQEFRPGCWKRGDAIFVEVIDGAPGDARVHAHAVVARVRNLAPMVPALESRLVLQLLLHDSKRDVVRKHYADVAVDVIEAGGEIVLNALFLDEPADYDRVRLVVDRAYVRGLDGRRFSRVPVNAGASEWIDTDLAGGPAVGTDG